MTHHSSRIHNFNCCHMELKLHTKLKTGCIYYVWKFTLLRGTILKISRIYYTVVFFWDTHYLQLTQLKRKTKTSLSLVVHLVPSRSYYLQLAQLRRKTKTSPLLAVQIVNSRSYILLATYTAQTKDQQLTFACCSNRSLWIMGSFNSV